MERWIIRFVALMCLAGSAGLLWTFGVFVVVPWRAGRLLALSASELQVLAASLGFGIGVGTAALHLFALGEREAHPRRYALLRAVLIIALLAATASGVMWSLQRG